MMHESLAAGRWFQLSLAEQLGNVGSEVGRAARWEARDQTKMMSALIRAHELIDLTLSDPRWHGRTRELGRLRETLADAELGGILYHSSLQSIEKYLMPFAYAARRER